MVSAERPDDPTEPRSNEPISPRKDVPADARPSSQPGVTPEDRALVEEWIAECILAMDGGDADPVPRVCSTRPDLQTRVQRRLQQLAARGLIPQPIMAPTSIGPFRIVRELGSGGMGAVYLAEQTSPVRRDVAVKVIKLGMDTREVVARFHAERQALARMNHPHIAQVFDAGITPEGRPWFAMEFVAGEPLGEFCDRRALTTEQRVQLLATVARAVQHAHERGFIHRDLKPSNVLVTAHDGQFMPKIIDFGIAKAATPGDEAMRTRADQILGTPEYMSPEQARSAGLDVDTRTDVWSLGVVLYELLCGQLPFEGKRLRSGPWSELERILAEELPTPPSQRLATANAGVGAARGTDRTTLRRRVAGELDWIALKAMQKLREDRYASALAFAEDLERWLRHEPVIAAPPGTAYRLRKFVRRHRVAVGAGTAVLLSLVTGLVMSLRATWQAQEAQARESAALDDMRSFYGLARDAVASMVDVADERLAAVPQADLVRREMLADAIRFYGELQQRQPTDPELRIDLLDADRRVGELQYRLGQVDDAIATLQRCVRDADSLRASVADEARVARIAIEAEGDLARALTSAGRSAEAKAALESALALHERVRGRVDEAVEAQLLTNLALETEDAAAAADLLRRALRIHDRIGDDGGAEHLLARARSQTMLAEALTKQNRLDEAAAELHAAMQRFEQTPTDADTALLEAQADLENALVGVLRRLGRLDEATDVQQRAVGRYERLATEHPDVPGHADRAAAGWHALAQIAQDQAQLPLAIERIGRAVAVREAQAGRHPDNRSLQNMWLRSLLTRADLEVKRDQFAGTGLDAAKGTMERAVDLGERLVARWPEDVGIAIALSAARQSLAAVLESRGETAEALRGLESVRETLTQLRARTPDDVEVNYHLAVVLNNLVLSRYRSADPDGAIAAGQESWQQVERVLALDARHRGALDLVSQLTARTAAAMEAAGDDEGVHAVLLRLCTHPLLEDGAHETGALLLAQHALATRDENGRFDRLQEAERELRKCLERRGSLQDAARRSGQSDPYSHPRSRLRDLDLRVVLADVLGRLGEEAAQAELLAEARALAATWDAVPKDRLRNLYRQSTEVALGKGDVAGAERLLDELAQRVGEHGGANYGIAVLLTQCADATTDGAERSRLAERAVTFLAAALRHGEVEPGAIRHPNFTLLRDRDDYRALLAR